MYTTVTSGTTIAGIGYAEARFHALAGIHFQGSKLFTPSTQPWYMLARWSGTMFATPVVAMVRSWPRVTG
jgi:hypothetical protein